MDMDHNENPYPETVEEQQEEYVDINEVSQVVDTNEQDAQPIEDDEADTEMAVDGGEGSSMQEEIDFVDDSVQGFFTHKEPVYCVAFHPTEHHVVMTGGGDDKAYVWRIDTGEQVYEFAGHSDSVTSAKFSADGKYAATGGMDGRVKIWNIGDGSLLNTLEGPDEVVWIDWHPVGPVIIAGASDGTVWMWHGVTGACMNVFAGHNGPVTCGQFTHDGKKIVTASEDCSLIVWDPKTATAIVKVTGDDARFHQDPISCLAINKDDTLIITGSADSTARLINLQSGNILGSLENHEEAVEAVGFCDTLPIVATGSIDGKISIWDVTTMRLRGHCQHDDTVIQLKWHKNSHMFTTCSADRTVRVWDARTGNCEHKFQGHEDSVLAFDLSYDGHVTVTGSDDGVALVFNW
ncbi:WD40 repeat-like protein [Basidiobolus meristosporus CBS 931.73]|uniref:WD40 repeat-like protein n=1 Tax=Basidiobolus meristosporus CBS 931.73 TaxID=1314790 RepID=A0A1Y1X5D0_9FUNG|nr:WD40 repeat-like protein [Basidiobolus meristosporus CBS 931.73]|eukprot:ORX80566.1 WD40 repeat-like protein [Basidiobolus meristosporus CBS 931.73]